jgi:hypothetical protein
MDVLNDSSTRHAGCSLLAGRITEAARTYLILLEGPGHQ